MTEAAGPAGGQLSPPEAETHTDLTARIGRVILEGTPDDEHLSADDHLRVVSRASQAEQVTQQLLHQAVAAARADGVSWAALGSEMGLSRQGAQQRFGTRSSTSDDPSGADDSDGAYRWLGPVTALDEMEELRLAGQLGWHTVEAGMLRHKMVRTNTQWEHRRVLWTKPPHRYEHDGWQIGVRAFPWLYLVRDLGIPARLEP